MARIDIGLTKAELNALKEDLERKLDMKQYVEFTNSNTGKELMTAYEKLMKALYG